jgi:hypothetical protein
MGNLIFIFIANIISFSVSIYLLISYIQERRIKGVIITTLLSFISLVLVLWNTYLI